MNYLLTGNQMRAADLYTMNIVGLPADVLMERAALKVVEAITLENIKSEKVLILCGSGNNGGDGYAVARLLYLRGCDVEIVFVGEEEKRSVENYKQQIIAEYYGIPIYHFKRDKQALKYIIEKDYDLIVDAIFGTGLTREITGNYADIIYLMNSKKCSKVSIDIPSGIHDTTGEVMGTAFCADLTVTIAFMKRGLVLFPGTEYAGKIIIGDIGIINDAIRTEEYVTSTYEFGDLIEKFPKRKANSHKGSYGKVLMICGSKGMSGAAYLSAHAAYAVGAGLVQIYTTEDNRVILQQLLPEAIVSTYHEYDEAKLSELLAWADVVGIGCGIGTNDTAAKIVRYTIQNCEKACIVDADALNILSQNMGWIENAKQRMIFTPHMKEMSRLQQCTTEELSRQKEEILLSFVQRYPVICVLKDSRTWIAQEEKDIYINLSGNASMAKAGSGDVLTGMISGILAQGTEKYEAALLGTYLHGLAGDVSKRKKGSYSVLARDIIDGISEVLKELK